MANAASPYSLGVNTDFQLDPETEKALSELPPEMQEVAKRGLQKLQSGEVPADSHSSLASQGQQILAARLKDAQAGAPKPVAVPEAPPFPGSPYGVQGGKIGPETREQAVNEQLQAAADARAKYNLANTNTQQSGSPFMPDNVPQFARGSGGSASEATSDMATHKEVDMHKNLANPEDVKRLLNAYGENSIVRGAQEGIQKQENQLAMMQKPKSWLEGANLGPMMALMDHFLGSNTAQAYTAPETNDARQQRVMTALEKIQTARDSLSNNQAHMVSAGAGGLTGTSDSTIDTLKKMLAYKDPQIAAGAGIPLRAANEFNQWTRSKLSSNDKAAESLGEVLAEIRSGNPIDDKRMAILRAKIDAGGRPNIAEVGMESGDRDLLEQARQTVSSLMGGKMTPHNRDLMLHSLETIMQEKQKERDMYVAQLRSQGTSQYQQSPEQLEAALPSDYTKSFAKYLGQAAAAHRQIDQGGNGTMNPPPKAKKSTGLLSPDEWLKTQ